MNDIIRPLLAGVEGYGAAMAQLELAEAYGAGIVPWLLAALPWWRRGTRWLSMVSASITAYLVWDSYRGNNPLPWSIFILSFPLVLSVSGAILAWKLSRRPE